MADSEPMGTLYFSDELYGDDMVALREAVEDAGFNLQIDPIRPQAELQKVTNDD